MKSLLLIAIFALSLLQTPPVNNGIIEGKVTRAVSSEGIPDVQVTLIGPTPVAPAVSTTGPYTPSASLTPAMREQINNLINSAPPGISPDVVANAAARMESQLLGLSTGPV